MTSLSSASAIFASLAAARVDLAALVQRFGTPFYLYSAAVIRAQYRALQEALASEGLLERSRIHYAVKANDRLGILRLFAELDAGADLVSIGEHLKATRAGIKPVDQVFSGVGKSRAELTQALHNGVGQINVESLLELHLVGQCAEQQGVIARVAFRLNPDTRAGGHSHISTGAAEHKFGLTAAAAAEALSIARASPHLHPCGIAIHIGSQIIETSSYTAAFIRVREFLARQNFTPEVIDLGGGFAIDYDTGNPCFDLRGYARTVRDVFSACPARLCFEPGRFLVAHAGVLVFQVLLEKNAAERRWVIADLAMNDFLRPALYQARHRLSLLSELSGVTTAAHLAGPVCESTDQLVGTYDLPPCPSGSLLALHDVGAYGSVMSMAYNARRLPPELLLDGENLHILRRAINPEDLLIFEEEACPAFREG